MAGRRRLGEDVGHGAATAEDGEGVGQGPAVAGRLGAPEEGANAAGVVRPRSSEPAPSKGKTFFDGIPSFVTVANSAVKPCRQIGAPQLNGGQAGHEVRTALVAHLQDEIDQLRQRRGHVLADHVACLIAGHRQEQGLRVRARGRHGHRHTGLLQRLDERCPGERRRVVDLVLGQER
jgi:hypothetical protein